MSAVGSDRWLLVPSLPQSQPGLPPGQARCGHRLWRGLSHLLLRMVKSPKRSNATMHPFFSYLSLSRSDHPFTADMFWEKSETNCTGFA